MEKKERAGIDGWLRDGGSVVTASERGARAVAAAYHRARLAEGLTAWPAPDVKDWQSFAREEWEKRNRDARIVLNSTQEQAMWAEIIREKTGVAADLEGPRQRLAAMAMEAYRLICSYAPKLLDARARSGWQQDAGAFSGWLAAFDEVCRRRECVSASRLALELANAFENDAAKDSKWERKELFLAGFDRILPVQQSLLEAWGAWRQADASDAAAEAAFFEASDSREELAACALWCKRELSGNPNARLLVVTQNVASQRGEIERALLRYAQPESGMVGSAPFFEFSMGVPVAQTALGRGALLTLRWLSEPIAENELDWLLSTGQLAADDDETRALLAFMRELRRRNLQRTEWKLTDWMMQPGYESVPAAWARRMTQARRELEERLRQTRSPLEWVELAQQLLETAGWPGGRPLGSEEFQVTQRLEQSLNDCGSLGFDGRRVTWREFVESLRRAAEQALFAPESRGAPILIAGSAETAGLAVDGIWFLGASEDAWPAAGTTHPFLPIGVQREARMPHAAAQFDLELAQAMTARMLASAPQINFSYARLSDDVVARPSRVIAKITGAPQKLRADLEPQSAKDPETENWTDQSTVPFPGGKVRGGSAVLTAQSQCPFKAFATARLGAEGWDSAEAGLTAMQRGILLHAVLKSVWDDGPDGIRSYQELRALEDLRAFVEMHVLRVFSEKMPASTREQMPERYLELEQVRLTNLVVQWLEYERTRAPFTVEGTEVDRTEPIGGLDFRLRMDRVDRLKDGKLLVIDYKSGDMDPKVWDLPRPDDVQLPLYAGFALPDGAECGGLVFAKVRAGELEFAGRVGNAKDTLRPKTSGNSNLVKKPLTLEQMNLWKEYIEKCAENFMTGHAAVDPRDYPDTCKECALKTLCRIEELQAQSATGAGDTGVCDE